MTEKILLKVGRTMVYSSTNEGGDGGEKIAHPPCLPFIPVHKGNYYYMLNVL
jgi:hypothetical protein